MAAKRKPQSLNIGDAPGQRRRCDLKPSCSELLKDPEAVLRQPSRWPDHLCYWTLHESIERHTGLADHWPIPTGRPSVDRVFALQARPAPLGEWLAITGTGKWDDGVVTFLPDMDTRWSGFTSLWIDWRAEMVRLANKWWNENIAGETGTGGHPYGRGTFSGTDDFLRAVADFLADNAQATQLQVATALAKASTVSPLDSMKSWRSTYKTGTWAETKCRAIATTNTG